MPTYDVTIRMVIHKTYRVEAKDPETADMEAREICTPDYENGTDDYYEEDTLEVELVAKDRETKDPIGEREALELSRQLWDQVAKLPDGKITSAYAKDTALEKMGYFPERILNKCFACEYARDPDTDREDCTLCPVEKWRALASDVEGNPCVLTEYGDFVETNTPRQRRAVARKIRNLMRID